MSTQMILNRRRFGGLVILGCAGLVVSNGVAEAQPTDRATDAAGPLLASRWNQLALRTTAAAATSPAGEARTLAIVHTAMLDAVVAAENGGRPYSLRVGRPSSGSSTAAATAAAHHTLRALHPGQRKQLDAAYSVDRDRLPADPYTRDGLAIGHASAAAILALRTGDGIAAPTTMLRSISITPFVLGAADQFRPEPPPELDSRTYAEDYDEVRSIGGMDSGRRSRAQTDTARLWGGTAPQHWNRIVQQLAINRHLSLVQSAETFALVNLAGVDAFVAAEDAGPIYARLQPVAAIHAATAGVAPARPTDPGWSPLITVSPGPEYPTPDTTYAGAAEAVLITLFGPRPGRLTLTSDAAPGIVREHIEFQSVATEMIDAQVWGGAHWRSSCVAGRNLGNRVGRHVLEHGLQAGPSTLPPVRDPVSGRLLDRLDRWAPRGPVITTP
ncbi:vanadium-dependent haloperoxidase [Microlunatus speluncae]|uniref:vanadium-dependent haloperoxidase n=1 Tax=Microlunatus speluncae TaxID=2594267 RepID=UPI00126642E4|nr:vanadium-dependent haloperoxidase [Microlunatus speluncae]